MKKLIIILILPIVLMAGLIACAPGEMLDTHIWGNTEGTTYQPIISDPATNAIVTIEYSHHKIHEGDFYVVKGFVDLANGAVVDVQITTPGSTRWVHVFGQFDTETEYQFFIYEGVTIVTPGVAQTPRNRNRNEADASTLTIATIENANVANANVDTPVAAATLIYVGITGAAKKIGGEDRSDNEFVLRRNTIYCFRLVCVAAGWADFDINWYEHTNE